MSVKARENRKKYLKAPTPEQVKEFVTELQVSSRQFETFYGIPTNTILQVVSGSRNLPAKFWDIIYERKKPAYGVGFLTTGGVKPAVTKIPTKINKIKASPRLDILK